MGDKKSEVGSRFEALQKKPTPPPIIFLLQHSSAPGFWLLGFLASPKRAPLQWRRDFVLIPIR
jgi:hypothetical protein